MTECGCRLGIQEVKEDYLSTVPQKIGMGKAGYELLEPNRGFNVGWWGKGVEGEFTDLSPDSKDRHFFLYMN